MTNTAITTQSNTALTTATHYYSNALNQIFAGGNYATAAKQALSVLRVKASGDSDEIAVLKDHLAQEIERNADGRVSLLSSNPIPKVNISDLDSECQAIAKQDLEGLGYEIAPAATAKLNLASLDDIPNLSKQITTLAVPTRSPTVQHQYWVSGIGAQCFGGMMHGGFLTKSNGTRFRLISGPFHYIQRWRGGVIETSVQTLSLYALNANGAFASQITPRNFSVGNGAHKYFHTVNGFSLFCSKTAQGAYAGFAEGNGRKSAPAHWLAALSYTSLYYQRRRQILASRLKYIGRGYPFLRISAPTSPSEIAQPVNKLDPFNAYFSPDLGDPHPFIVYASPYLKVVYSGRGPAIILWTNVFTETALGKWSHQKNRLSHDVMFV